MPQADDELRAKIEKMFGDPVDDSGPYKKLIDAGFVDARGILRPPAGRDISDDEWTCIAFLCDEWDYSFDPEPVAK